MTDKVLAELKGMTEKQRNLVALVYLKGKDSLKEAIAKVKGETK